MWWRSRRWQRICRSHHFQPYHRHISKEMCPCRWHAVSMGAADAVTLASGASDLAAPHVLKHQPIVWAPSNPLPPLCSRQQEHQLPQRQESGSVPESAVSSRLSHLRLASSAAAADQQELVPLLPRDAAAQAVPPQHSWGHDPDLLYGLRSGLQQGSAAQQTQQTQRAGAARGAAATGAGTALMHDRSASGTLKRVRR